MPNAKHIQIMSKELSIAGNAAIDRFLRTQHKDDMVDAMRYAWRAAMATKSGEPLTFNGVPIVWDVYTDTFGLTQQEKDEMSKQQVSLVEPRLFWRSGFDELLKPAKPKKLPPYRTVGVRFIHGHNLLKVYTYRVRKAAKVHLGQEVIVESNPPSGWTKSLAVIVRIDTTPQDNGPFNYLWIEQAVKAL